MLGSAQKYRAERYGAVADYFKVANDHVTVLVQIETRAAVAAAAEIDAKQAAGAAPSLPIPAYAGAWRDPWYGEIRIEERTTGGIMSSKKARAWELFVERWDAKTHPYENGMLDVFLAYFADAYDVAVKKAGGKGSD